MKIDNFIVTEQDGKDISNLISGTVSSDGSILPLNLSIIYSESGISSNSVLNS